MTSLSKSELERLHLLITSIGNDTGGNRNRYSN